VNIGSRKISRKFDEAVQLGWRVVSEVRHQRNGPTIVFLRKYHPASFAMRSRRNDSSPVTIQVLRPPPKESRGVAESDFDTLLGRLPVAQGFQPLRAVRPASACVHDKIG